MKKIIIIVMGLYCFSPIIHSMDPFNKKKAKVYKESDSCRSEESTSSNATTPKSNRKQTSLVVSGDSSLTGSSGSQGNKNGNSGCQKTSVDSLKELQTHIKKNKL